MFIHYFGPSELNWIELNKHWKIIQCLFNHSIGMNHSFRMNRSFIRRVFCPSRENSTVGAFAPRIVCSKRLTNFETTLIKFLKSNYLHLSKLVWICLNVFKCLRCVVRRLRTTQTAGNFGISQKNSGSVPEFFCEIPEKIGCLCTRKKICSKCLNIMFKIYLYLSTLV